MQIYAVLWDYKCKSHWPLELGDLKMSPGQQLQKSGCQLSKFLSGSNQ